MQKFIVKEREYIGPSAGAYGTAHRYSEWKTIGKFVTLTEAEQLRSRRVTALFERVVTLAGKVLVDARRTHTPEAMAILTAERERAKISSGAGARS